MAMKSTTIVKEYLLGVEGALHPGEPLVHGPLGVCPLFKAADGTVSYLNYEEAILAGTVKVGELGEAGSVPELVLENLGAEPVLILDGEQLVGAKQNRVLNTTVLIGAGCKVVIPVTCVEQGRWHYEQLREMRGSREHLYARTRAEKSSQVLNNLFSRREYSADQHAIWHNISDRLMEEDVHSPTSAMEDHYAARRGSLEIYLEALSLERLQGLGDSILAGAVFTLSGKVLGVDAFSRGATVAEQWPKLLNSYAIEALRVDSKGRVGLDRVRSFIECMGNARMQVFQPPGLGEDVRMTDDTVVGSALVYGGEVIHLCAFNLEDGNGGTVSGHRSQMSGYRDRMRGHM